MRCVAGSSLVRVVFALAMVVASLAGLVSVRPAQAATFLVNDGDVARLKIAIIDANSNPGPDTIELAAGGTYTLTTVEVADGSGTSGLPLITSEITINGNGATITRSSADGTPDFRIVTVGSGGDLTLDSVTISNGRETLGGGIYVTDGELRLTNSTISGNVAHGVSNGGGINGNTGSTLYVTNTTISGNTADVGGGIITWNEATIINSTISGNTATQGRGLDVASGTPSLINTIVAGNTASITGNDISGAISGTSTSNLIGDGTGMTGITDGDNGNQVGTTATPIDPLLDILADNGGPTQTMALLFGSPAIDAGTSTGQTPATDQRGVSRPQGAANDIGAFEFIMTYADLCTLTQQLVGHPIMARVACASLRLAERAAQVGNVRVEQVALNMYRMQIRIGMAFRVIPASNGQYLIDLSYAIDET